MIRRFILKQKNRLAFIGGILIAIAFAAELVAKNISAAHDAAHLVALWSFVTASVLGALPIAIQAFQSQRVRVVSIDVLVTIAVTGAFLIQNYEEAAIVSFLFLFGAYLEQRTLNQTRSAIKSLTELAPESALRRTEEGEFEEVDIEDVDVGDVLLVKTGAKIPVDGTVLSGEGHVNEASITGESVPSGKSTGSMVYAGTILENGTLQMSADRVGEDTTFGRIIELVEEAQDSKSKVERFMDRFARYYTPAVLVLAIVVWIFSRDIELAITILVLGCPGALVIGVPISNVAGIGNGARHGVLLKGSEVIHSFSKTDTIAFDKTGTLTEGNTRVADSRLYTDAAEQGLDYLYSIESESDHPLARALVEHLGGRQLYAVTDTHVIKGGGIVATVDGHRVAVGNAALMEAQGIYPSAEIIEDIRLFEQRGSSLVLSAADGEITALFGVRDQVRPGVRENLRQLRKMGIKNLILLSGDNQRAVDPVAAELGMTEARGHMLPEDKAAYVAQLQAKGHTVAFVGDGVNDSPSLALADIGIAMGGGTDVAIETSDVVLMSSDFSRLPHALGLAKATARNMAQNIFIAIAVVLFLLASVFFSEWMNMSIGMLLHEGSILVVILNGMRLLRYKSK